MRRTLLFLLTLTCLAVAQVQRWPAEKANQWYQAQPWLVGANYSPASAINQLEMWQADTFDPRRIDTELGWAESIGMNTMRVFLHDLLWHQDPEGFRKRVDQFLSIAHKHQIRPMLVLFDSVWDPNPQLGRQRAPKPGVHNSGWMQSPGAKALADPAQHRRLEAYVKGIVGAFGQDERVLAWDLWNEPENLNGSSYRSQEPANKIELVTRLLPRVFEWARSANPRQPLTAGVWQGDWYPESKVSEINRLMLELSDVITFHNYGPPEEFTQRVELLKRQQRPLLCTEYMARGNKSTFEGILPIAKQHHIAAYNWGLVAGKTQTNLPWDSWQNPYVGSREPAVWFHEVFRTDGTPYRPEEVALIRKLTGRGVKAAEASASPR